MLRETAAINFSLRVKDTAKRESLTMNEIEFENFYNEHSRPLRTYVLRLTDRAEIAADIMQESFLKFLSAELRHNKNPKAYLYRIATNLTYDYFRRQKKQTNLDSPAFEEPAYEPFAGESGFAQIFDKLQMQERALLWLAYVEGHEHREVAEMLGLKTLSVRVLLFRARRKLAGLLEENSFEVNKL